MLSRCTQFDFETSLKVGTLFQDICNPMRVWFQAMCYVTNDRQGMNALGTQWLQGVGKHPTAWAQLHKLQCSMVRPARDRLLGTMEIDESFVGGCKTG